jgi:iron(III) transport system substrate-binding protein
LYHRSHTVARGKLLPRPAAKPFFPALLALFLAACGGDGARETGAQANPANPGVVNVYTHRHYEADQELFRRFTEQTGVQVNVVSASADELITRLENEGAASPADLLITVDAGRLHRARERGLLQPVRSEVLESAIPDQLRDAEGHWFGLTRRARVIVYHRARVQPEALSTYEALAEPAWRGRVLTRSSSNVYSQSLLASILAHEGEAAAERWAAGLAANLARAPSGGDTDQIKALAAGVGDVAIVNTYYLAKMAESTNPEERRIAAQMGVHFPNQEGRGAHVNVSGAGVTRHAPNRDNAVRLIEFLAGEEAQALFAEGNQEYPAREGVAWSSVLRSWGDFRADSLGLARLGELNAEAVRISDRVGWR